MQCLAFICNGMTGGVYNMNKKITNDYVQAFVPDKDELAELIVLARGDDRSMAEFARVCKVKSASTFSRITNGGIDKPVSDELLIAVAQNAADKQKVTLDLLMRANGKIPKDEMTGEAPSGSTRKLYKIQSEKVLKIKDILVQHYLRYGHSVMIHPDLKESGKLPRSRYGLELPSDFALHVEGIDPLYWNFSVDFTKLNVNCLNDAGAEQEKLLAKVMNRYSSLFLLDAWDPKALKDFKNTIVFTDNLAYTAFTVITKDIKTNNMITAMYIDDEDGYIDAEYHISRKQRK